MTNKMISSERIKELRMLLCSLPENKSLICYDPLKSHIVTFGVYITHPAIVDKGDWHIYEQTYEQLQYYLDDGFKIAETCYSNMLPGSASGYWVTIVKQENERCA